MKLASIAMLSVFVGCLGAQTSSQSESQTTTTTSTAAPMNMEGTLVDQGCYTTHSHSKETTSDPNSTTTVETTKNSSDCPATNSTTNFALLTPEGKMVRFDDASNRRVVEMMKSDRTFSDDIHGHRPVKVRVVATPNGDVMVIKDIKTYQ